MKKQHFLIIIVVIVLFLILLITKLNNNDNNNNSSSNNTRTITTTQKKVVSIDDYENIKKFYDRLVGYLEKANLKIKKLEVKDRDNFDLEINFNIDSGDSCILALNDDWSSMNIFCSSFVMNESLKDFENLKLAILYSLNLSNKNLKEFSKYQSKAMMNEEITDFVIDKYDVTLYYHSSSSIMSINIA